jgi:hypothetical protein
MPTTRAMSGSSTPARIIAPRPGAFEKKPKGDRDDCGDDDDRQTIVRKNKNAETRETGQFWRCRDRRGSPPHTMRQRSAAMKDRPSVTSTWAS